MSPRTLLELLRVRQWVKNGFVLAPLFFGAALLREQALLRASAAFAAFCLLSSAVYIFNDWRDIEADSVHAKKKKRALASGRIGVSTAFALLVVLVVAAIGVSVAANLPPAFFAIAGTYAALNIAYSLGLKHVSVLELFIVSSGFVLRLLAGGIVVAVVLSPWIIIATSTIALLAAIGKRRGDIARENDAYMKRKSLARYSVAYLDAMLAALAGATLVIYLLFCVSTYAVARYGSGVLLTAIPVGMGLLRYVQLVIVFGHGEAPTELVTEDKGLIASVALFIAMFAGLIYAHLRL